MRRFRSSRHLRRLATLAGALAVVLGAAACGQQSHPTSADTEGQYVDAGPITYQVQSSRQLNPYAVDDKQFLAGATGPAPAPDEEWFGVWLWAKNQTSKPATTSDRFDIVDTLGKVYYPIPQNPAVNPFVWLPTLLAPNGTEPVPDSAAWFSQTQGGLVLFKINITAYSNRPLTLQIYAAGQAEPSTVSLDL